MDMLSATTLYPMMRCLHGWSVRSPAASEMAISGELARHLAASDGWESAAARRAPELWMTSEALARGFAVCDAVMAAARPAADGSLERVAALFSLMTALRESVPAEREGPELFGTPGDLQPSPRGLLACQLSKRFIEARRNLEPVWRSFLRKETVDRLMPPGDRGGALLSDGLWAHILFELAEVFCEHRWFGPPVLETFPILHAARAAAFHSGTCADIEHSCRVFEAVRARLGDNRAKGAPAPCLN